MPFEDGIAKGDSIKLPLFGVEPEQISDLVIVPNSINTYSDVRLITRGILPFTRSQADIQKVSFPLSEHPCLFQRYNPYGLEFADGYSKKLFDFLYKFSYLDFIKKTELAKIDDETKGKQVQRSFDIGKEIEIELPTNNQRLDISYYLAEITFHPLLVASSFGDYAEYEPGEYEDWRTVKTPNNQEPVYRHNAYEFERIQNQEYKSPQTRRWKLKFQTFYCKGQTITIDRDLLIASLVLTPYEFQPEDLEFLTNQIPECYFYSYIDTFFNLLEEAILESNPSIGFPRVVDRVKYPITVDWGMSHYLQGEETINYTQARYINGVFVDQDSYLTYKPSPDCFFKIYADDGGKINRLFTGWANLPSFLRFGAIIYANNNYWDNYDFNLRDVGTKIHFRSPDYWNGNVEQKRVEFWHYGNFNGDRLGVYSSSVFSTPINANIVYLNDFSGQAAAPSFDNRQSRAEPLYHIVAKAVDGYELTKTIIGSLHGFHNDYFARLIYRKVESIIALTLKVGMRTRQTPFYIPNDDDIYKYLYRPRFFTEEYYFVAEKRLVEVDFNSNKDDFGKNPDFYRFEPEFQEEILGSFASDFSKYGEPHPESKRYVNRLPYGASGYEPNTYFEGHESREIYKTEPYADPPRLNYDINSHPSKTFIVGVSPSSPIRLDRHTLDKAIDNKKHGSKSFEYELYLTPERND